MNLKPANCTVESLFVAGCVYSRYMEKHSFVSNDVWLGLCELLFDV